jgi:hypothetical protein
MISRDVAIAFDDASRFRMFHRGSQYVPLALFEGRC